jgi:hypothetical protein
MLRVSLPVRRPALRLRASSRRDLRARAIEGEYNHIKPNFDYINMVLDAFPDAAVASPDEARVRFLSLD